MSELGLVELTRALVDIDSTTGREHEVATWLARYLRVRGFDVREQRVDASRFNIYAAPAGPSPRVVLSTHLDCVPPFFPSRLDGDRLYGRGSCDAKGILAAQVTAAERLRNHGRTAFGMLFVVGEERGGDGALAANHVSVGSAFLIDGEPTDTRLGSATRGLLRLRLRAAGRAAHTSYPEVGESAIEKLIDVIVALRGVVLPAHPIMGRTHYTVGLISGGVAPNVVPPSAEAEVLFRTVGPASDVWPCLKGFEERVSIEQILDVPPVNLTTVPGFDVAAFPFTTDIPSLSNWGRPLLYGPGSILVAHTADEHVSVNELERSVQGYVRLVETLGDAPADLAS